ncbi:hypothetical protein EHQ53_14200 [Leptospira langatensis]|uniref:Bacteriophage lambda Replication protein O N-terminal domain-containing protein n=1 Tax=Leptospira langatensis TaxID=2484983 RepID=A0ABY2M9C9_9LEPT|nr:hypothetical protein [Leptospira langatensis]TGL39670.1 hypothetical protein EHQ53_14200 [Leptospira langatensis]
MKDSIRFPDTNYFKVPNEFVDDSDYRDTLDPYETTLMLFYMRMTWGMRGVKNFRLRGYSVSYLSQKLRMSESKIKKARKHLVEIGLIILNGYDRDECPIYFINTEVRKNHDDEFFEELTGGSETTTNKEILLNKSSGGETNIGPDGPSVVEEKIPFKQIADDFTAAHLSLRKTKVLYNGKVQTLAIKRLWKRYGSLEEIQVHLLAFIYYLKNGKGNYFDTQPILPTSITEAVSNQILPFVKRARTKIALRNSHTQNEEFSSDQKFEKLDVTV